MKTESYRTFNVAKNTLECLKMRLFWSCINRQICCTAKEMSDRVNVKYCSAPAKLRYRVGSCTSFPTSATSLDFVLTGVRQGLQCVISTQWRMSGRSYVPS